MVESSQNVGSVTAALRLSAGGDREAKERLLALVYDELHQLARAKLSGLGPGQTLQTTALVHEAWMRVSEPQRKDWDSRAHFFGAAARVMRNILVDQSRRRSKLGKVDEDEAQAVLDPTIEPPAEDMLALDECLARLEEIEPRKAQVVMLRFFTGLSTEAVADVLKVSVATVERDWRFARAWLQDQMESPGSSEA